MKVMKTYFTSIFLLMLLTTFQIVLAQNVTLLIPDTLAGEAGDTIEVPIMLDRGGNDIAALGAAIKATNNLLDYIDFVQGPVIPGSIFNVNAPTADSVRLGFFDAGGGPITQDGLLATLKFQINSSAMVGEISSLNFSELSGADPNFQNLTVVGVSGKVTVIQLNTPPQLRPISDQTMNEGETLDVSASATDPDGDNITLSADNLPTFGSLSDNGNGTGTIYFSPAFDDAGTYPDICIIATDDGNPALSDTACFTLTVMDSILVDIKNMNNQIPTTFGISANYPNPFNPTTTIKYQIPKTVNVELDIYNILGQKVRTLVNARLAAGYYEINWDGTNERGDYVGSGIYIYIIESENFVKSKKMILLK